MSCIEMQRAIYAIQNSHLKQIFIEMVTNLRTKDEKMNNLEEKMADLESRVEEGETYFTKD